MNAEDYSILLLYPYSRDQCSQVRCHASSLVVNAPCCLGSVLQIPLG